MLGAIIFSAFCLFLTFAGYKGDNDSIEKLSCPHGFQNHSNMSEKTSFHLCFLPGDGDKTWGDADQSCRNRYSFLIDLNTELHIITKIKNFTLSQKGFPLIWIGLRKMGGFYTWQASNPKPFQKSNGVWGGTWSDENEFVFDCAALDPKTGKLVTRNCSSLLPYICMNYGSPAEPLPSTLCPEKWIFTNMLSTGSGGCLRMFEKQGFLQSLETCEARNATLITEEDFHGVYEMLKFHQFSGSSAEEYWVYEEDVPDDNCTAKAAVALQWLYYFDNVSCDESRKFYCKISVNHAETLVLLNKKKNKDGKSDVSLTCEVNVGGKFIPPEDPALNFRWTKNGALLSSKRYKLTPMTAIDDHKVFGHKVSRQGSYQCHVLIAGNVKYTSNEEFDAFLPDVSSYVLTIEPTTRKDFTRVTEELRESMEQLTKEIEEEFGSAEWDNLGIYDKDSTIRLKIQLFIKWENLSRPENEEEVFEKLKFILKDYELPNGYIYRELQSADTCFDEKMNISSAREILWPETQGTSYVKSNPPCFDGKGEPSTRLCKASFKGAQWAPLPDNFTCNHPLPSKEKKPITDYCREEVTRAHDGTGLNLTWPRTLQGQTALPEPPCLKENRSPVVRRCLTNTSGGDAYWEATDGECGKQNLTALTVSLRNLSMISINQENIAETTEQLRNITAKRGLLEAIDLHYVATTLENIADTTSTRNQILEEFVDTYDNIMVKNPTAVLKMQNSSLDDVRRIADSLERMASTAILNKENGSTEIIRKTVTLKVWDLKQDFKNVPTGMVESSSGDVSTLFNGSEISTTDNIDVAIAFPLSLMTAVLNETCNSTTERLVFMTYKNYSLYQDDAYRSNMIVNSFILHAKLGNKILRNLEPPIKMIFKPVNGSESVIPRLLCGFWNESLNGDRGGWSTDGCQFAYNNSFICTCNHLTNFAILMSPDENSKVSEENRLALDIITYIGCGISLFGLITTVLTYLFFKKWRKGNKHQAICNLSVSLALLLMTFLAGIERTEFSIICKTVAMLLHYFLLVSLAWMLVEAVIQYLNFVKVFSTYIPRFMRKAMICAWGSPSLIVIVASAVNHNIYGKYQNYCWISYPAFYYVVALPVGLLLFTNIVVFCLIVYSLTCGLKTDLRCNIDKKKEAVLRLRASVCIFFLLGLSWSFGFMAVSGATVLFQYLFAMTTTLQGFAIFVYSVLCDKSTRHLWESLFSTPSRLWKSQSPPQTSIEVLSTSSRDRHRSELSIARQRNQI